MSNSARSASSSASSASSSASTASYSGPPVIPVDPQELRQLLKACKKGDFSLCNPDILFSTTPHKNNCLHIAAILGHHEFAREVWSQAPSLFSGTNIDGETPLIASLMAANLSLASDIITAASQYMQHNDLEEGRSFNRMLLKADRRNENALHHAMRNGFEDFALQLLDIEPELSEQVTNTGESPMYMVARRGYSRVIERLLQIQSSANSRPRTESDLPAAVRLDHAEYSEVVEQLQENPSSENSRPRTESDLPAAVRLDHTGYSEVVEGLLEIPSPAVLGPDNESAMHAAVKFDNPEIKNFVNQLFMSLLPVLESPKSTSPIVLSTAQAFESSANLLESIGIVKQLLVGHSQLAYHKDKSGYNPMHRAVLENKLMLVKMFLEYDPNLAYIKHETGGITPFIEAVAQGYLSIAKEIMSTCPDSVYTPGNDGDNALHYAIFCEQPHLVDYILKTTQLHRLINQAKNNGGLPLHEAAPKCDPKILRSLLTHAGQDYTAVNVYNNHAVNEVYGEKKLWKTLKWNESFTLLSNVIPSGWNYDIRDNAKRKIQKEAIEKVQSLTTKYTSNTSLVAALLATITFAAAFTLPGGLSSDSSDAGQPLFARKAAFQVFLISDTIAMCSSLAVAFLCILATWEDLDFLLNYRKTTRALMWCAYGATAIAFGTGLFTVIAPKNKWLAILILILCTILPLLSKIIGEWPLLMLRYRLGGLFQKDLVPFI